MLTNRPLRTRRQPGMTLIELGLVIGVFGFIMIFVVDFFSAGIMAVTQPDSAEDQRRVTVRHVNMILEAARSYHNRHDNWPTNAQGEIHISGLAPEFLDLEKVRNIYIGCGDESNSPCTPYTLKGWNRDQPMPPPSTIRGGETTDPAEADDLILEFGFPGGVYSFPRQTNQNDPAVILAKLIPLGIIKGGASGSNETLIEARIHRTLSRPYLVLDGERRVASFDDGDWREVALLSYNNEDLARSWRVTGPAISLMPVGDRADPSTEEAALERINAGYLPEDEVFIGTGEVTDSPTSYLRMRRFDPPCRPGIPCFSSSTPSVRSLATFGIRSSTGQHHQMVMNAPFPGNLSFTILPNTRPSQPGITTPLRMELVPADPDANVEAHWDIRMSNWMAHRSLQTRLCALESEYSGQDGVSIDCSCPGNPEPCR